MEDLRNKMTYFKYCAHSRSWFSKFDIQVISCNTYDIPKLGKLGPGGINYPDFFFVVVVGLLIFGC